MPALQVSWAASAAGRLQAASVFFEGRQDGCVRRCADVEMLPVVLGHSYGRKAAARLLGMRDSPKADASQAGVLDLTSSASWSERVCFFLVDIVRTSCAISSCEVGLSCCLHSDGRRKCVLGVPLSLTTKPRDSLVNKAPLLRNGPAFPWSLVCNNLLAS